MYEDIKQQFKQVITYSQGIENPKVDKLFEIWANAKSRFIDLFGGLIYEWPEPIEFTLDPQEKRSKAMQFSNSIYSLFRNEEFSHFIDENLDSFFDNVVEVSSRKDIPKGMNCCISSS